MFESYVDSLKHILLRFDWIINQEFMKNSILASYVSVAKQPTKVFIFDFEVVRLWSIVTNNFGVLSYRAIFGHS